jgi:hypothetical protein
MSVIVQDDFTVGSDTALTSHTPSDVGTGYTMQVGTMTVLAASDDVQADSALSGTRAGADDSVGSTDMKVEGDFVYGGLGTFKFFGVTGRKATAGGAAGVEFTWDKNTGAWNLGTDSLTEAWPGGTVNMRLECIGGTCYGYVNDVLKVQDTIAETGEYAGFLLGDFDDDGGGNGATIDNFLVETVGASMVAESGSFAVGGIAASLEHGREVAADGATFTITGIAADLRSGRTLAADTDAFAVTGIAAGLTSTSLVDAEGASYAVSGQAAALEQGRRVSAEAGAYAVNGTDADLLTEAALIVAEAGAFLVTGGVTRFGRTVVGDAGAFVITGTAAALEYGRVIVAAGDSYAITGTAASLVVGRSMPAAGDSFGITGVAASLLRGHKIAADGATYVFTGIDASLLLPSNPVIVAEAGAFAVAGVSADLLSARVVSAEGDSFVVTGTAADFARTYIVAAEGVAYIVTGSAASLSLAVVTVVVGAYATEHADAYAKVLAAGGVVTFERTATVIDKATGRPTTTDVSMPCVAVKVGGDPRQYAALGLLEVEAATLLFAPASYAQNAEENATTPKPGDVVGWQGQTWNVRGVSTLDPDGAGTILGRAVVSL